MHVDLQPGEEAITIGLTVENRTDRTLSHVTLNICASVNHLPGQPGWCNRRFIPDVPLDRSEQGCYWYQTVTPRGLKALTAAGWVLMHLHPDAPRADDAPPYETRDSGRPDAVACAVVSHDGSLFLYQAWDAPCYYVAPFRGNACMHLKPLVREQLPAGGLASVRGRIGLFRGDWASLAAS